ncbi:RrF2 family transcriptional regulator [Amycolatopsis silviterrae]|uniref:RrF2 family transcriptional regulator n=1 Tax=Amycolatopsis silviterrae TaxID=1656914 RepID=A0ABW5HAK5_9PSEU
MKLSNGIEWVLHCCVTLSQAQGPVPAQRLAELHDIPPAYLAKHLQVLSRAGVVHSSQGQDGGYGLTRPPGEISVLDVVAAIDGPGGFFRCTEIRKRGPLAAAPERCTTRCSIARAMADAELAWNEALSKITIADLAENIDADSGGTALGDVREWLEAR